MMRPGTNGKRLRRCYDECRTVHFERLGRALAPNGDAFEREGVLNPACARLPDGRLTLYPRCVAAGNVSRIGRCIGHFNGDDVSFERDGYALEPCADYELRDEPGGYGCEDPRVTFVSPLGLYVMAYCGYGRTGARIAIAISNDGLSWQRLGRVNFPFPHPAYGNKDAAFFPDVVTSRSGVPSIALLHRPTMHRSVKHGRALNREILEMPPEEREGIRIGYVPLKAAAHDPRNLVDVQEEMSIMSPNDRWGRIKIGAGTPPVRTREGWLLLYHGIDELAEHERAAGEVRGERAAVVYRAGIAILDAERPHIVRYRSPQPLFAPETPDELRGTVDAVVFPTGIDRRNDLGDGVFDIYYGMADDLIGRGRLKI
jgi:beta-1,2-mannobiose phosphorylase / 1,2-beta-oligomannan phosphorylase